MDMEAGMGNNNVNKASTSSDKEDEDSPATPDSGGSADKEGLDQAALEQARVRMWAMNFAGGDDVEDYIEDPDRKE
jgi:hypothetical protein